MIAKTITSSNVKVKQQQQQRLQHDFQHFFVQRQRRQWRVLGTALIDAGATTSALLSVRTDMKKECCGPSVGPSEIAISARFFDFMVGTRPGVQGATRKRAARLRTRGLRIPQACNLDLGASFHRAGLRATFPSPRVAHL